LRHGDAFQVIGTRPSGVSSLSQILPQNRDLTTSRTAVQVAGCRLHHARHDRGDDLHRHCKLPWKWATEICVVVLAHASRFCSHDAVTTGVCHDAMSLCSPTMCITRPFFITHHSSQPSTRSPHFHEAQIFHFLYVTLKLLARLNSSARLLARFASSLSNIPSFRSSASVRCRRLPRHLSFALVNTAGQANNVELSREWTWIKRITSLS